MTKCPACLGRFGPGDYPSLARHFVERAASSDPSHVRWLNQNLSRQKLPEPEVAARLQSYFDLQGSSLSGWIKRRFIARFYGPTPHPFAVALQHPSRGTLLGYVVEHQHFLRQWVRSCAYIMARTDEPEVVRYELDNLNTEYGGIGTSAPAHYELLLRMGESLGLPRDRVLAMAPLPSTAEGLRVWDHIAMEEPWVEALAAMHSLELIANRELVHEGATIRYFDPSILAGTEVTPETQAFLREGYEADVGHSDEALHLVDRYAVSPGQVEGVQATFLRSADAFDDYLMARLERGQRLEG